MSVKYRSSRVPGAEDLAGLYGAVGWSAYTEDPALLHAAVSASLSTVTAHDGNRLVGLARVVGDGLTIVYSQDILVLPEHQRSGIGRTLFERIFAPFSRVRQKVLLTDEEPSQRAFYEAMGFIEVRDHETPLRAFVKFG